MLPHQLLTAPLISALHDKIHPFPFINTLPIYFFWENCQPPLFNKPLPTIRGRRLVMDCAIPKAAKYYPSGNFLIEYYHS